MNARAIIKAASALAGISLSVLGLAAPAQAGQWVGTDPGHDVAAYSCKPGCHWKDAPGNASADMVREQVTYRHEKIKITVTVRDLDTSSAFALTSILKKTERAGRYYGVIAAFSPGKTPQVTIRNPHGTPVSCGAATPRVAGDKIKVVVPARCLHSPDWVRWSGYMRVIFPGDLDNDAKFEGYFDKFRTSSDTPLNKHTYEFSRRIYRAA
ncbi:MAG TPA: hypothetical protein VFV89_08320 [Nocardioides sp.]|uniref:hypothetical protein n=1 Tax=Nocardioides sp. TaxID=35761 RepID=UPI002E2F24B0|nr:hypothetical protein [Nocardioides sp.]HEX5087799.1 hypothetical protein [Nocardioides sp.]